MTWGTQHGETMGDPSSIIFHHRTGLTEVHRLRAADSSAKAVRAEVARWSGLFARRRAEHMEVQWGSTWIKILYS